MKKIIVLSALPGSGKSTWANAYIEANKDENIFIISSDEIRKELGGSYKYFKEEARVWELFLSRAIEYGDNYENVTVILDSTNLTNNYRKLYFEKTPNFEKHVLVFFNIPYERACAQNFSRDEEKIVPEYAMEKLLKELEPVSQEVINLYDTYIEIN